jgi:hypothetical protein
MINARELLGNAHYQFITGIEGVSISEFGLESQDETHIYITSYISVKSVSKSITSTFNPHTSKITHKVVKRG